MCSLLEPLRLFLSQASFCFNETDVPFINKDLVYHSNEGMSRRGGEKDLTTIKCNVFVMLRVMLLARTASGSKC